MSFALHPDAEAELNHIVDFIGSDSLAAARRLLDEFEDTFARLARTPRIGHRRPELTSRPLRFWTLHRFVIAYDPEAKPLVIVMVIHGMRSPRTISHLLADR
jgi:plasmid stabilization system protein ParE